MRVTTALGLLFCAGAAIAQGAQAGASPTPPGVSYVGGQLRIDVLGATLADVLAKVAALTGVTIDLPEAAKDERLPAVQLGPGPAREVLASLLSDSDLDYLIQASDADANRIQSVMIMPREKKGSPADAAARAPHSPFGRSEAPPAPVEDATAEAAHGSTGAEYNGSAVGDSEEVETGTETVLRSVPSL